MKRITKTLSMAFAAVLITTGLNAKTGPTPADAKAALVADWERAKAYTLEYLDAMPEDGTNFKPVEGIRSFAEQMLHIANANVGIMGLATGAKGIFEGNIEADDKYKNKKALRDAVSKSYDHCIQEVKNFDITKAEELVDGFGGAKLSRMEWMKKNFEHQTHHRGQTTIYLRAKGVTPPPEKLF